MNNKKEKLNSAIANNNILNIKNVSKQYKFRNKVLHVLDDVSLTLEQNDFITIQGRSGSGKSTLLNIISGIIKPTKGNVFIENHNITKAFDIAVSYYRSKYLGFVFQSFNLISYQTVLENVMSPLKFNSESKLNHKEQAIEALKSVELFDKKDTYPDRLSGGQMQRVAIARAIVKNPKLILADEPTGNLDKETSKEIVEIFKKLNDENGITFIVVTHDNTITEYSKRNYLLKDKKLNLL